MLLSDSNGRSVFRHGFYTHEAAAAVAAADAAWGHTVVVVVVVVVGVVVVVVGVELVWLVRDCRLSVLPSAAVRSSRSVGWAGSARGVG